MIQRLQLFLIACVAVCIVAACSKVPLTGRSQLNLIPSSEMMAMSAQQYGEFLKTNPPSSNAQGTAQVQRVGVRIQHAVEQFMTDKGMADKIKDYKWEFNLVESKEVNAWCMPGGKVVVY